MRKYLHKFANDADFEAAYNGSDYVEPWVSYTERATEKIRIRITNESSYYTVTYLGPVTLDTGNTEGYAGVNTNSEGGPKAFFSSSNTINVGDTLDFICDTGEGSYDYDDGAETVISMEVLKISKVDYNKKDTFDGDLIVDLVTNEKYYRNITGAKNELMVDLNSSDNNGMYEMNCSSPLLTNKPDNLKVRCVYDSDGSYEDLIFETSQNDTGYGTTTTDWMGDGEYVSVYLYDDPCGISVYYGSAS